MSEALCEMLLESGALNREQVEQARVAQQYGEMRLGIDPNDAIEKVLIQKRFADPRTLAQCLCRIHGKIDYILIGGYPVEPRLTAVFPRETAFRYGVMPLVYLERRKALFLSQEGLPLALEEEMERRVGAEVVDLPSPYQPINDLVQACYETVESRHGTAVRLGEILVRENLIETARLEQAVKEAKAEGIYLGEYLVRQRLLEETQLTRVLALLAGVEFLSWEELMRRRIDLRLSRRISKEFARYNKCLPVESDGQTLVVATLDPLSSIPDLLAVYECVRQRVVALIPRDFAKLYQRAFGEVLAEGIFTPAEEEAEEPETEAEEEATFRIHNPTFLDRCLEEKIFAPDALQPLVEKHGENTLAILMQMYHMGMGTKEYLGRLWGDSIGVAYLDLEKTLFESHIVQKLPESFARRHKIILVFQFGQEVTAATVDPANTAVLEQAQRIVGHPLMPVFSLLPEVEDAIEIQYRSDDTIKEMLDNLAVPRGREGPMSLEDLEALAGDEAVIEFTRSILLLGLKERASDIHIEPGEYAVRIRYRVDGHLQERMTLDPAVLPPLVSRLKILAEADIMERRLPQDGRIGLALHDRSIDFRFSSVPTIYGEKVVLRILGQIQQREVPDLSSLGFSRKNFDTLRTIVGAPNGIFLVTGPTGSGKSTTLYAALKEISSPEINVVTAEDPVEYRLPGITQVQMNHEIGLDFGRALRAFLRQDPDVILVGEIRDTETARIASEAALTGHFVLGSLHTNSALQAVTRLVEMGVEPHLVAPSIAGVMAQRLVRRICEHCQQAYAAPPQQVEELFGSVEQSVRFYRGKGCEACKNTGYAGRVAIHEVFAMTEPVRNLVARGATILEIEQEAFAGGFLPMHYDGVKKVLRGLTTLEEITHATVSLA